MQPHNANKVLYEKGVKAYTQGNLKIAIQHLSRYVAKPSTHVEAWKILGFCHFDLKDYPQAISAFEHALALEPSDGETWFNTGICYTRIQNMAEAIRCYTKCVQLNPNNAKAHTQLADAHKALNQIEPAIAHYMSAIQLRGLDAKDLLFKLSQALLVNGAWQEGFELFEARTAIDLAPREHTHIARWQGQALQGKTILVECEQGFGDSIQFSRYLHLLHHLEANILLACPTPLQALFAHNFPWVSLLEPGHAIEASAVDFYIPLMSLAGMFQTTPNNVPFAQAYLTVPPQHRQKWAWLAETHGPKIGMVWSGNPKHQNDKNRSLDFEQLWPALPLQATYFSLQKNEDASLSSTHTNLVSLSNKIECFADTAAICEHIDKVITVDTSIAHLSGAMGRPTCVMLPFSPDWRWLLHRKDSVWYESVTLLRQTSLGDWPSVLTALKQLM